VGRGALFAALCPLACLATLGVGYHTLLTTKIAQIRLFWLSKAYDIPQSTKSLAHLEGGLSKTDSMLTTAGQYNKQWA